MRGEFVDISGARIYYYAAGTRGAGNPVVLIHGFPTSSHLWSDVVPLIPRGHRIVVVDLLGYGRSDRPLDRRVDVQSHADRMVALFDELRLERACIVGHGMGGAVAMSIAATHAERVSHLCVVDGADADNATSIHEGISRASMRVMQLLPPSVLVALVKRDLLRGYTDSIRASRSVDLYLRPFAGADGRAALIAHLRAGNGNPNAATLRALAIPTALVWGENDGAIPLSVGIRLRDSIPRATLTVIPGARHFTPEEAPQEVADAIGRLLSGFS